MSKSVSIWPRRVALQELEIGPLHRFHDWPNQQVPKRAAGVYTVWEGDRLLYVGMSGRAMTAEDLEVIDGGRIKAKELWTRLNTHANLQEHHRRWTTMARVDQRVVRRSPGDPLSSSILEGRR